MHDKILATHDKTFFYAWQNSFNSWQNFSIRMTKFFLSLIKLFSLHNKIPFIYDKTFLLAWQNYFYNVRAWALCLFYAIFASPDWETPWLWGRLKTNARRIWSGAIYDFLFEYYGKEMSTSTLKRRIKSYELWRRKPDFEQTVSDVTDKSPSQ